MSRVIVSAPGKIILHGEHAVVYGKSAVAFSVGLRTKIEIDVNKEDSKLKIVIPNVGIDVEWSLQQLNEMKIAENNDDDSNVITLTNEWQRCLKFLIDSVVISGSEACHLSLLTFLFLYFGIFKKYKCSYLPLHVFISSQLPIGAGLGSSASYSVCIAASLLAICGKISPTSLTDEQLSLVSKWAYEAEKILHGKPSGVDNSICTYGGALLFKNGEILEKLSLIPSIEVMLINTKVSRNTKSLVAVLRKQYDKHKEVINHVMSAINCISESTWKMLKEYKDQTFDDLLEKLQELLTINHHLLNALGVGHPQLNTIVEIATAKKLGAKLTGAGGGGCAFILLSVANNSSQWQKEQKHVLQQILHEKGFECWDVLLGCPGVLFHQ
ncbi:mevalonate kinase-like isoform X1 [Centruroides sculpturatus]|uniref:mevalonate kinase-like isoform X1 n=2 Tax=Centruroides sculpturatus TaxID=218467 RepID=UPI000C6D5690|nr:mevalonate kinase-like isoform X1 [Centruroides sculpturatus]